MKIIPTYNHLLCGLLLLVDGPEHMPLMIDSQSSASSPRAAIIFMQSPATWHVQLVLQSPTPSASIKATIFSARNLDHQSILFIEQ